jgi:hypothetical protein
MAQQIARQQHIYKHAGSRRNEQQEQELNLVGMEGKSSKQTKPKTRSRFVELQTCRVADRDFSRSTTKKITQQSKNKNQNDLVRIVTCLQWPVERPGWLAKIWTVL